ncbi:hypothetical protein YB2330_004866 [Saitoella coloradoensis]
MSNLFDLLGDDFETDALGNIKAAPVEAPKPVAKEVVKATTSTKTARRRPDEPRADQPRSNNNNRNRGPRNANEEAVRDKSFHGRESNKERPTDEDASKAPRGPRGPRGPRREGRGAGNAGSRGREFERHSATGRVDSEKAVEQGWGKQTDSWEASGELAAKDRKEEAVEGAEPTETVEVAGQTEEVAKVREEEEDNSKTLEEYLAEQAAKTAALPKIEAVRTPNEGADDSKWAKNLVTKPKVDEVEDIFAAQRKTKAAGAKKDRKEKQVLEIEQKFTEPARAPRETRAPREARAPRGRGGNNQRGAARGAARGNNGQARGPKASAPAISDESAFPSLGA